MDKDQKRIGMGLAHYFMVERENVQLDAARISDALYRDVKRAKLLVMNQARKKVDE
jgi:hypothetical protein